MNKIILCKYGEIALKGLNKKNFEILLEKNVKRRLKKYDCKYSRAQSTLYIEPTNPDEVDEIVERVSKVFGIAKIAKAAAFDKDFDTLCHDAIEYLSDELEDVRSFKVQAKRADKQYPLKSPEIACELGGRILEKFPHLTVDVKNPQLVVNVEIREKHAFVHGGKIDGAGGIPVGSSGNSMLLLSGGIDSPVAGVMMAKRGVVISAIHFEAPPYTSERARLKVEKLASLMTEYCGDIKFFCVPFTKLQELLRDNCPEELFTIIMRRLMLEIAQRICKKEGICSLITGESIGQVASQTMYACVCTDAVCNIPVFRPVIGMDKSEIVEISRKINTFETSIEPYEDCCTVFTPKHPKTKPILEEVEKAQSGFDFEPFIEEAVEQTQIKIIRRKD